MPPDGNWLQDLPGHPDPALAVFSGQNLVVAGGSSGMGRQTAADVVAAGASAVIIGQDPAKVDDTVTALVNAAGLFIPQPWNIDGGVTAGHN